MRRYAHLKQTVQRNEELEIDKLLSKWLLVIWNSME